MAEAKPRFIAEFDEAELAVRMCEANYRIVRPYPSAIHALENMDEDVRAAWHRSARAALEYFFECIERASTDGTAH
jgi:hypothetical protein